ncbi:uncharacterized protein BYT42DRAFT_492362 [Radiomyces spectabilis]|uniref:uncharacterized protein n=1 Tax=Radiomyces spectabilis TaxID=64574 RepID=UPI00221F3B68|nr:uncharacterized protein BYT42DRAFT_492362 [Radiomyces spectabilis]KAI8388400.1 hypothetical protein BYT42DRAFT_492362 [Radiomyces spectabilis]
MNQAARGSRVVFVGNIPFELTEEQLIDVFKEVGPVASFRLLFDRESGRPKGYGFCEFYDAETAASAVRNLNDYEVGGRQLRVDYAAMDDHQRSAGPHNKHAPQQPTPSQHAPPPMPQVRPSLFHRTWDRELGNAMSPGPAAGKPGAAPVSSVVEISKVLASMSPQDLFTLMSQMKQMCFEKPDAARDFLTANPQVSYALFQAMVMMNIVDPNIITRIMSSPAVPAAPAPAAAASPVVNVATPPPAVMQTPVQPSMPPMPTMPVIPPSQPPQPPVNHTMPFPAAEQQKALLMQVLQLTEEQINALPPEHREQIRLLVNFSLHKKCRIDICVGC